MIRTRLYPVMTICAVVLIGIQISSCRIRSKADDTTLESIDAVDQKKFVAAYNVKRAVTGINQDGLRVELQTTTLPIRLDFLGDRMFKIRYSNRSNFSSEYTYSIAETFKVDSATKLTLEERDGAYILATPKMKVLVHKADGMITVVGGEGVERVALKSLFADGYTDERNRSPGQSPQKRVLLGAEFSMHEDEHFYGLGQKLRGSFDQSLSWRGRKREIQAPGDYFGNHFDGVDGAANGNVMIPFLLSNRGVGVFFDTVYQSYWEFDDPKQKHWYAKTDCDQDWQAGDPRCARSEMRFYVMVGDNAADVLSQYASLTGPAIMPPRWLFGFQQSRYGYANWDEVDAAVNSLKKDGFPLDGVFLDLQWFGGVPGVFGESDAEINSHNDCKYRHIGQLEWSERAPFDFSDARKRMANLKARGVHIVPIEEGYIDTCLNSHNPDNQNFSEAEQAGFLARKDFGSHKAAVNATGDDATDENFGKVGYFGQVGMIDTSSLDARRWFWSKHLPILKDGASMFWTDLGEPERFRWWWKYAGGKWHQDIHNVWDLNRARSFYEGYTADLPSKRPFVLSRSGYAGSQRYGSGIWSADAPAKLGWAAAQPSAHMNLGISGVPYTTSDVGGFGGFPFSNGPQYARWLQMEAFSSLVRSHGNTVDKNAWRPVHPNDFGEPYTSINRKYLMWRETLVPYIYTAARESFQSGMPVVRALPLLWPRDPHVADLGSEFMLGSSILVAPVLTGENNNPDTRRDIYLPAGRWFDMHDGKLYKGGQWYRGFAAPLAKLPLFARDGAILPKAVPTGSLSDPAWMATRIFEVYPAADESHLNLYDDDGESNDYKRNNGGFAVTQVKVIPSALGVKIGVGPLTGTFEGVPTERAYGFEVRLDERPTQVSWKGASVAVQDGTTQSFPMKTNTAVWNSSLRKLFVQFESESVSDGKILSIVY